MATTMENQELREKQRRVSQYFVSDFLPSEWRLLLLGHSVKDESPGGSKEAELLPTSWHFLVLKIKDHVSHGSQEVKSKDVSEKGGRKKESSTW